MSTCVCRVVQTIYGLLIGLYRAFYLFFCFILIRIKPVENAIRDPLVFAKYYIVVTRLMKIINDAID